MQGRIAKVGDNNCVDVESEEADRDIKLVQQDESFQT